MTETTTEVKEERENDERLIDLTTEIEEIREGIGATSKELTTKTRELRHDMSDRDLRREVLKLLRALRRQRERLNLKKAEREKILADEKPETEIDPSMRLDNHVESLPPPPPPEGTYTLPDDVKEKLEAKIEEAIYCTSKVIT